MTLEINVPLEAWERTLLSDAKQKFGKSIHQQSKKPRPQVIETFRHWAWAVHVENVFREVFDDAKTEDFHQENHHRAWKAVHEGLSTRGAYHESLSSYSCHSRLKGLLHENPKLAQTFSDSNLLDSLNSNVSLVPADRDIKYWEVVTDLRNFLLFGGDDSDSLEEARFEEIEPVEIDDATARKALEEYFKGFQNRAAAHLVPANEFPGIDTDEGLMSLMEKFDIWILTQEVASLGRRILYRQESPWKQLIEDELEGLFSFAYKLEYIPISELRITGTLGSSESIVLWEPQIARILDHQLFTEDAVYGYCIDNHFAIPEYLQAQSVVFMATELTVEDLARNRKHLRTMYNDCALTMDPISKKPYFLETRPGRKFRNLTKEFGLRLARSYFRSIIDRFQCLKLRDILRNVDETISWVGEERYEGIVDAIPFSEIVLTNERAGGRGGNVHFGKWRCKQKLDMAEPQEVEVVLKRMWPPDKRHAQMFIRELQNSIHSFATKPIGSIELCGITLSTSEHNGSFPPKSVFLVLEQAQKLGQFLNKNLSGSPLDWDLISELFRDLATSLENLHMGNYSVIHRDIHMDNIVLRQQPCPNDPYVDTYNELVIIDLGESQRSNFASQAMNMYGNSDYWAPEVVASREYSEKSDVFSVGYVMVEIIRQRCHISKESRVPKPLWDLIHKCLARDATDRPNASELVQRVEKLRETFFWVPETINALNRGRVVFPDEPSEDFSVVVRAWRESLTVQESGSEDDIGVED